MPASGGWTNPLRDPADRRLPHIAGPSALVIFGITGDLSRRKLMPAIYDLANRGLLPPSFALVGFARREWDHQDFAEFVKKDVEERSRTGFREEQWAKLAEGIRFVEGSFEDDVAFDQLRETLAQLDRERGTDGNHAFYLAIPPKAFPTVLSQLRRTGMATSEDPDTWQRVVIEKPFGHDLESARELNTLVNSVFPEESVFRIDHYLGKETVQNILALRFANQLFEPLWNSHYIDHVQITMAEDIGLGGRAGYYDGIGAARDVIQNHLLQLLALIAMEEPVSFSPRELQAEKIKVLSSTRNIAPISENSARGQYGPGWQGSEQVPGLLEEGFSPDSTTETYAAIAVEVDTRRWAGVPFFLRTGKRLGKRVTEIALVFKRAAAFAVRRFDDRRTRPERDGDPDPAGRGRQPPLRLQGAEHQHGGARRQHGLQLRRGLHGQLPGGLRATAARRPARRAVAVPGERGSRIELVHPGPRPGRMGGIGPPGDL